MLIADCLIVAAALGAGVAIMRNHRVDQLAAAQRALAAVRQELEGVEEDLALAHQDVDRAQGATVYLAVENLRLRADPPWMQQPLAAFAPATLGGNVVALSARSEP